MRLWTSILLVLAVGCDESIHEEDCVDDVGESFGDPFGFESEWTHSREDAGVRSKPVWGQLTDDNGDGVINDADHLDVVFTSLFTNALVALDGEDGGVIFEIDDDRLYWESAIGDVDGDGVPDVVVWDKTQISVLDATGTVTLSHTPSINSTVPLRLADVNGDGTQDILVNGVAYDAKNEQELFSIPLSVAGGDAVVTDLDQDGQSEVILGLSVYGQEGDLKWQSGTGANNEAFRAFAAVAESGEARETFFFVEDGGRSQVFVHDPEGDLVRQFSLPSHPAVQPQVADFDGDGELDLAVSGGTQLGVFNRYGEVLWSVDHEDVYGSRGLTAYDFDFNGAVELVQTDGLVLQILDGASGSVRFEHRAQSEEEHLVYPQAVDTDGDGQSELTVSQQRAWGEGTSALSVFKAPVTGWVVIECDE